jgi:hypothetical protein
MTRLDTSRMAELLAFGYLNRPSRDARFNV